jgi:hypothetical protein
MVAELCYLGYLAASGTAALHKVNDIIRPEEILQGNSKQTARKLKLDTGHWTFMHDKDPKPISTLVTGWP